MGFRRPRRRPILGQPGWWLAFVLASSACGSSTTTPTTPTATAVFFSSQIQQLGSAARTFTLTSAASVGIMLTSLSAGTDVAMGLDLGTPDAIPGGCAPNTSVIATPSATDPQIATSLGIGTYCVRVYDVGNLGLAGTTFSVSITINP
jgi:hypothetical protein